MSRLAQPVAFELGGSARTPWEAEVDGERRQVRANEVPESAYRYSLLVDGEVVEEFHDWPTCWTRVDPYLQREYEDEREKSEYQRRIGPSKLVT